MWMRLTLTVNRAAIPGCDSGRNEPIRDRTGWGFLAFQWSDLDGVKVGINSAAISAIFFLETTLGKYCSSVSKTYSSGTPSFAASRYRSSEIAGTTEEGNQGMAA